MCWCSNWTTLNFHSCERCFFLRESFDVKCVFFPRLELLISRCIWKMGTAQKAMKGKHTHESPACHLLITFWVFKINCYLLITCQVFQVALQAVKFFTKTLLRVNCSSMKKQCINKILEVLGGGRGGEGVPRVLCSLLTGSLGRWKYFNSDPLLS